MAIVPVRTDPLPTYLHPVRLHARQPRPWQRAQGALSCNAPKRRQTSVQMTHGHSMPCFEICSCTSLSSSPICALYCCTLVCIDPSFLARQGYRDSHNHHTRPCRYPVGDHHPTVSQVLLRKCWSHQRIANYRTYPSAGADRAPSTDHTMKPVSRDKTLAGHIDRASRLL